MNIKISGYKYAVIYIVRSFLFVQKNSPSQRAATIFLTAATVLENTSLLVNLETLKVRLSTRITNKPAMFI